VVRWLVIGSLLVLAAAGCGRGARPAPKGQTASSAKVERGLASWYGGKFHGRRTASGETFDKNDLTAAHRTRPFGSCVRVHNVGNGRWVEVRINDRGPFSGKRVIDVSEAAARRLDMVEAGLAKIELWPCG
jgi:rare lipoprotein A